MGIVDGLGGEELGQAGSQVSNAWVTGSIISQSLISGLNVFATGSVIGADVENAKGILRGAGAGSPTSYGKLIQAGSGVTNAGSEFWMAFGTPFAAVPLAVVATPTSDTDAYMSAGSIVAGSFLATSHNAASVTFTWLAIGA
jgi:hypothetical protein